MSPRSVAAVVCLVAITAALGVAPAAAASPAGFSSAVPTVSVPSGLDFGQVPRNLPRSGPSPVYIVGSSSPAPTFENLTLTGADAADFHVTTTDCSGQRPGCSVNVVFDVDPDGAGTKTASLLVYDDAPNSPQAVLLTAYEIPAGIAISPTSLDFGNVAIGTTSAPQTVTISSTGLSPLNISGLSFTQTAAGFQTHNDNCTGASVAPASSCTVQFTFSPTGPGSRSTGVVPLDNASPYLGMNLVGVGTGPFVYGPGDVDFRGVAVGSTLTLPITLVNSGSADVVVGSDVIGGANPGNFAITGDTCVTGPVHAGASCEIDVAAHANAAGTSYTATLTITDNTVTHTHVANLSEHGVGVSDTFSASSFDFGDVPMGQTAALPLTITNNGPGTLSIDAVWVTGSNADFSFWANCFLIDIAPSTSCQFNVGYFPSFASGTTRTATLHVNTSTGNHTFGLQGSSDGPGISFAANPLDLGTVNSGSPVTKTQTVTNNGNATLTVTSIVRGGWQPGASIVNDNCTGVSVAIGGTCTFGVRVDPCCDGAAYEQITVSAGQFYNRFDVTGTAHAANPSIDVVPAFPETAVGATGSQTFTINNKGSLNWTPTALSLTDTTHFGVLAGGDHCTGQSVAPGASCSITLTFSPAAQGDASATLDITGNPNVTFGIYGTGVVPWAGMVSRLAFGNYEMTKTSPPTTLVVRNIMAGPLHVNGVTFSAPSAGFSLISQTCQNVPRGGACQLVVQFAPATTGPVSSYMTLVDDEGSPHRVLLTATGLVHAACQAATLTAFPGGSAAVGNRVVFNASSATCALPQYEFLLQPSGGVQSVVQPWGDASSWTWDTSGQAIGSYGVEVRVRDRYSDVSPPADFETNATASEELTSPPCSSASVTPDRISPAQIGTTIVLSASSGACGTPLYEFWMLAAGSSTWVDVQEYSNGATFMWNTTGMPAGTYRFAVWARDSHSAGTGHNASGSWDAAGSLSFVLTVHPTCNLLKGSVSPAFANAGQPVDMNVSSSYCPNPLYQFWLLAPGSSKWVVAQPYSPDSMFVWDTNGWVGGTYKVLVWAKDASSPGLNHNTSGSWDTYTSFSYYVQPVYCQSIVIGGDSLGTGKLRVSGYASGCPNPRYEFWVKYPGATGYRLLRVYSTTPYVDFNFIGKPHGRYYFAVWARDASSSLSYDVAIAGYVDW